MARKAAYRKKNQNRISMSMIAIIVVMLLIVVSINGHSLRNRQASLEARETELQAQIAAEETRSEELAEYEKYTQTKKYIEDVAKDKLGLVHEGEIIFKEE